MRYPGGKGKCYQRLINLMPRHHTYIESHLGGGAVLRNKLPAERNIGIDVDPKVISTWEAECVGLYELIKADALGFLKSFAYDGGELIYVDPPYLPSTRRRRRVYTYDYSEEQHEELLSLLVSLPCMVMLSGYDSELYRDRLLGWRKVTFSAKTHADVREECVWMNFPVPHVLHDARHVGETYRERQTINRRRTRIHERISRMEVTERNELIKWIHETYISTGAI
ncbi:DNA adenine methylase [Undibacterium sp. Ji83W]|uniref:DNA adenine methylase n=1 Tax=Undibacterium sp. Ji83W TaxID=3413043 RepID=UPI003BF038AD